MSVSTSPFEKPDRVLVTYKRTDTQKTVPHSPAVRSFLTTENLAMLIESFLIAGDDARELLDLLERAQAVAERIDAARRRCVDETIPLHPGESRGTDLAEGVLVLALRVRKDVQGGVSPHE